MKNVGQHLECIIEMETGQESQNQFPLVETMETGHAESLAQWSITKVSSDLKLVLPNKLLSVMYCDTVKV